MEDFFGNFRFGIWACNVLRFTGITDNFSTSVVGLCDVAVVDMFCGKQVPEVDSGDAP